MSARLILVLDAAASTIEYALVDAVRDRILADGMVHGSAPTEASVRHTVHFYAEPGEPAPTVLSATAETQIEVRSPDARVRAILDQFRRHGPSLDENPPAAYALVSDVDWLHAAVGAVLPGIAQVPVPAAVRREGPPLH